MEAKEIRHGGPVNWRSAFRSRAEIGAFLKELKPDGLKDALRRTLYLPLTPTAVAK